MVPVLSIVGWSNSGKTTLIEKLLPELNRKGLKVGIVKHVSHEFSIDMVGKDSYRHKQAGADTIMLLSQKQIAVVKNINGESLTEDNLNYFKGLDIVITEGFKKGKWPKMEVYRSGTNHEQPACLNDPTLIAIVTDTKFESSLPQFRIDDVLEVSDFIKQEVLKIAI